jgi:hypothetical protein
MDLDEFLGHSASTSGAGYLQNWKTDGQIDIWLHPGGRFAATWKHRWLRLAKDKETELLRVFGWRWKCMEAESVLKKQRFRNDDGTREYPPCRCPFCLLIEWLRGEIDADRLDWTAEVFKFEPEDDEQDEVVIHAGGFTGQIQSAFNKKTITKEQKKEFRELGIYGDEVFMETATCKMTYVLTVVQDQAPEDGTVIARIGESLGKSLKKVIRERREDVKEKGNPLANPYGFRWEYDANKMFSDMYNCKPMTSLPLTPEIQAAFDEEPPSIAMDLEPGNVAELRLSFEEHWCCKDVTPPWDEIFEKAEEAVKGTPAAELSTDFAYGANSEEGEEAGDDDEDDGLYECEVCGKGSAEPNKCEHCGAEYDENGKLVKDPREEKEEEKPKPRQRRSRKAAAKEGKKEAPKSRSRSSRRGGRRAASSR